MNNPAKSDETHYLVMSLVAVLVLFLGFAPSFYLRGLIPAPVPELTRLTIFHGLVYTVWMVLFIAQAAFVRFGKINYHRQLGILLALFFGAMLVIGYETAIVAGRLGHVPPGAPPALQFMALPLIGLTSTLIYVSWGLLVRRDRAFHQRLMLTALFSVTGPGTGRLAIPMGMAPMQIHISFIGVVVLIGICQIREALVYKKVHSVWWYAQAINLVAWGLVIWALESPLWLSFAQWLTQG